MPGWVCLWNVVIFYCVKKLIGVVYKLDKLRDGESKREGDRKMPNHDWMWGITWVAKYRLGATVISLTKPSWQVSLPCQLISIFYSHKRYVPSTYMSALDSGLELRLSSGVRVMIAMCSVFTAAVAVASFLLHRRGWWCCIGKYKCTSDVTITKSLTAWLY